jgi:hypothetical protein
MSEKNHPLLFAIMLIRRELLAQTMEKEIKPNDWSAVDLVIGRLFNELTVLQTTQTRALMEALSEDRLPEGLHEEITNGQIVVTAISSLILAHFEVVLANQRQVNDAHLHFDRVLRAAEDGQSIVVQTLHRHDCDCEEKPKPKPRKAPLKRKHNED